MDTDARTGPIGFSYLLSACPGEQAGHHTEHPRPAGQPLLDTLPYICIINSTERPWASSAQGQLLCQTPWPHTSGSDVPARQPPFPCHPWGEMEPD